MSINPTISSFITDLIHDNQVSFARIEVYKERIKCLYRERTELEGQLDYKGSFQKTQLIISYKSFIKEEQKSIGLNLDKIRGLRNGTIKEI